MSFRSAQLQNFSLAGSGVSISDTTLTLSSFQSIDGVDLALSDFGTAGYMTIEPGSRDREEQIAFYGVTQNSNGTATLTGIKSVLFLSPYTESTGFSKSHPGGVVAVVSNTSGFYNKLPAKDNIETITANWAVPDPVSATDIANKQWVLSVVNGGAVSINSVIVAGIAGETVASGNLLYFDLTDNEWKKTDADTASSVEDVLLGIAQGSGTDGNVITGGVLIDGVDSTQTGMTQGDLMYASNTAGGISSSTGTTERVVGIARTSTELYFNANFYYVVKATQKAALASTTTPTGSNKYITQSDFQKNAENYAASSAGTDAYAITLSPAVTALTNGMVFQFKADVANTGAATLDVNGLGALAITKLNDQPLLTGDIEANQIVTVVYNSTSTKFQMVSQTAQYQKYASGVATYAFDTATGTQNISHGLTVTPSRIRMTAMVNTATDGFSQSSGTFDGTNYAGITVASEGTASASDSSTSYVLRLGDDGAYTAMQTATASLDSTNIVLSWTKQGSPTSAGTIRILWEAWV